MMLMNRTDDVTGCAAYQKESSKSIHKFFSCSRY